MANKYDFKGLAQQLLAQVEFLAAKWLPDGKREGREWVATNPTRADGALGSFKVSLQSGKWSDFAVNAGGSDLISLYAYLRGLDQKGAYIELAGGQVEDFTYTRNADNARPAAFKELVEPVEMPENPPPMPEPKGRALKAIYSDPETGEGLYPVTIWRDFRGLPVYRVVTTRTKDGKKYPIPLSYCRWQREQEIWSEQSQAYVKTGKILDTVGWHQKDWLKDRPILGANYLFKKPMATVLITEGEKKWAYVAQNLPEYASVSWRGGCRGVPYTDWSMIRERQVIICPDYDEVGQKAALEIGEILKRQGNVVRICWESLPAKLHDQGWDIADIEKPQQAREWILKTAVSLANVEALAVAQKEEVEDGEAAGGYNALLSTVSAEILDNSKELRCLGYGADNKCYFICRQRGIVIALSANQLASLDYLLALMPLRFWYDLFPSPKGGFNKHDCADTLQRWADSKGYFNPDVIRGAGVWIEKNGEFVLHMGQRLLVGSELHNINEYESEFMYEATSDLGLEYVPSLSTERASALVDLCDELDWECPVYAKMLAGWAVVAPMCGGLEWRPHIWVTGAAGAGKTTVISKILHKVCGKLSLFVQGDSTAAGLRQSLGSDALAIIFDEFEGENPKRLEELQKTLDLARQASSESGAKLLKGSSFGDAVEFRIRSAFAFSSINVNIQHYADASRITVLTLKDPKLKLLSDAERQSRIEKYTDYERRIAETLTPEYVNALQMRAFELLPSIRGNARIFGEAVQKHLGSARHGQQLGILCAGAYSLQHRGLIDADAAEKWVKAQDWTLSTPTGDFKDHDECLAKMVQYILRPQEGGHYTERSVGEMIASVASRGAHCDEYDLVLKRYGFRVEREENVVYVANSHSKLKEIMQNTPYQTWHRLLLRCEGAKSVDLIRFSQGTRARAVALPLDVVFAGAQDKAEAAF